MSVAGLVWRNLWRRPVRTALTVAGVSVGVALIVALLSIAAGARRTAGDLIHVGRSDFGLFQRGASDLTRSVLPDSLASRVRRDPGVGEVARLDLHVGGVAGHDSFLLFGLDPSEFPARRLVLVAGRRPRASEALLGDRSGLDLRPGSLLRIAEASFRVAGLYHSGDRFEDLGAVLPLAAVQRLNGHDREVTTLAVTVRAGARPASVARRLERRYPGLAAVTEPGQAVKVDTSSRLILNAGWIFSIVALVLGGVAVANTMAMSVFERTGEIGLLRAVGWRRRRVALLVAGEAVAIGLLSLGVGLAAGYAGAELFTRRGGLSSLVAPAFTVGVFAWGLAFALGVGIVGALYPAWRASRLTPAEALRRV